MIKLLYTDFDIKLQLKSIQYPIPVLIYSNGDTFRELCNIHLWELYGSSNNPREQIFLIDKHITLNYNGIIWSSYEYR